MPLEVLNNVFCSLQVFSCFMDVALVSSRVTQVYYKLEHFVKMFIILAQENAFTGIKTG